MPTLARPEVDVLDGLTTAIIVDQERMGANPRSTVGTATDANAMLRILFSRLGQPHIGSPKAFSFNVPSVRASRRDHRRTRRQEDREEDLHRHRRHVPALRGPGLGHRHRPDAAVRRHASRSTRARSRSPATAWTAGTAASSAAAASSTRTSRSASSPRRSCDDLLYKEPTKIKVDGINLTYEGLIPQIQKSMLSKDVDAMQPHIRAFVERAVTFTTCPDCDGTRLSEARPVLEDRGASTSPTPARCRSATWPSGCAASTSRRWRRCSTALRRPSTRSSRSGSATSRLDRPVGHAVGRRGAAHQDDPPPRLVAHRRHLRLRRADDRAAPARHPADERPAAAAARQGQHRARRRAQAGDDRDRRPRRRPRPRRRHRRRHGLLRGHRRRAAGQRHPHRPPPRRPRHPEAGGADARRARSRSAAPARTTCRTSTSTSRSACWWSSPAWPGRARAR